MAGKPKPFPDRERALADWLVLKSAGASMKEVLTHFRDNYSARFGQAKSYAVIKDAMRRLQVEAELDGWLDKVPPASLVYHEQVAELRLPFHEHLIVLSDPHASAHDSRGVALFLKTIAALGIKVCVINGDLFDNSYLGHKGIRNSRAASAAENLHAAAAICNALIEAGIETVYVVQGNHDDKPLRLTDGEITYDSWWATQMSPLLNEPDRFTVTHRYYCIMDAMDPRPDGTAPHHFPTRFTHQMEYGRQPGSVAMRLADKFLMNMVCGHMHHLSVSRHKSGKFWIADAGTLQHSEGAEYKVNRDSTHPEWCPGFLTLRWGVPEKWDLANPVEWWAEKLGVYTDELA